MLIKTYHLLAVIVLLAGSSTFLKAEDTQSPLSLENQDSTAPFDSTGPATQPTTQTNCSACSSSHCDGFWIFPEPAPLTSPIATDRPGFSDTTPLVPRGHVQIEGGYTFTYDREGDRRTIDHGFAETALRTGLTDWLEFRAKWNGYSLTETLDIITTPAGRHVGKEEHDDGASDLTLGFKLPVCKQSECRPNISVITDISVPTGSATKSANNVVPELSFAWDYSFCEKFTAYGTLLGRVQDGSSGQFFQTAATLACSYQVASRASLFLEYAGVFPAVRNQDCSHVLSAGPVFRITDNFSLDMRASVGLNEQAPDFQASIGFGIRF